MKYWIYVEPVSDGVTPCWTILSEKAILTDNWSRYLANMTKVGKADLASTKDCIDSWVAVHWAVEATRESLLRIIGE